MPTLLKIDERKANLIVRAYPVFCLLYWIWLLILFRDTYGKVHQDIYWDGLYGLNLLLKILAPVGFLLYVVSIFSSSLHRVGILLGSVVIPMACAMLLFKLLIPTYVQVDKARFDDRNYFLLYHRTLFNHYNWILLECPPSGVLCNRVSLYYDEYARYNQSSNAHFAVDTNSNELHVVIARDLFYTVGAPTREYVRLFAETRLGDYTYHLSQHQDESAVFYNLYQCDSQFTCTKLPFLYTLSKQEADERELNIDGNSSQNSIEVSTYKYDRWHPSPWTVVFSYDTAPHCYVEACSILEP